jgi:hypothetical protein
MKAKLIKTEKGYGLVSADKTQPIASTLNPHDSLKLSKQNCEEEFAKAMGVIDVEQLANEYCTHEPKNVKELRDVNLVKLGFREGFNKAMELNKDKVFTEEDMRKAYFDGYNDKEENKFFNPSKSIQQPTEIEVMIVMEDILQLKKRGGGFTNMGKPKLDSEGCLILTKI